MLHFRYLPDRTGAALLLLPAALFAVLATAQPGQGVPVRTEVVGEQPIRQMVQLTGTVTSNRTAQLSAATGGLVTALHVDAGSEVAVGDLLLELDSALARWQWQSSVASAAVARIAVDDARRRLEEARTLAPQLTIAESVVRDLEAEAAQDAAELQRAEAEAGYRKGVLDRHQLQAPFPGVISAKLTELGEWVDPGEPVMTLVSTQELRMDFPVAEDYLAQVDLDTSITYTLGDNLQSARTGRITTLVPVTDPGARTFLLRAQPGESDPRMIPGMSARAQLTLDTGRRGLVVPRDAILNFPDGRVVVWLIEDGGDGPVATEKRVETGVVFEGMVEILEGVTAGDQVVVRGNESLQNGQRVILQSAGPD